MRGFIDTDFIVCDKCNMKLGNKDILSNKEYEGLIANIFNHAFPLGTTKLVVKCKECNNVIFTLQRLTFNGTSTTT